MKKIVLILFYILSVVNGFAQEKLLTLNEIIEKVQNTFPSLLQTQYNIDAINAKSEGAKSWVSPVFSVGLTRVPYDYSILSNKKSQMNQAGISFSIQQMIPDLKKQSANHNYILSLANIEKCNIEKQKNELRFEVKKLYYNRFIAEKKLIEIEKLQEILTLLINTETSKLEYNKSDLLSIYKAKAKFAEYQNMKIMLNGMINESNAALNILMQQNTDTKFNIDTTISYFKNYAASNTDSNFYRSDIEAMSNMIKSMKLEQYAVSLKLRPEFGIKAEHMQMVAMPSQWALMGMMTMPIKSLSDRMIKSEEKTISYKIKAMEEEKNTMVIMINRMTAEKFELLKSRYKMYFNFKDEVLPLFEKNLEVNILSYKRNSNDFSIVLDASEMLYMKKIEMWDIYSDILKTETEYEYEKQIK